MREKKIVKAKEKKQNKEKTDEGRKKIEGRYIEKGKERNMI